MFSYGYPGDVNEVSVTMGFYATREACQTGELERRCLAFLERFADTRIRLQNEAGSPIEFRGRYAALRDPNALVRGVLGRDVTDVFTVIVDRPGDRVCLVGQRHTYRIERR